jgi:ankyrin repeat protein
LLDASLQEAVNQLEDGGPIEVLSLLLKFGAESGDDDNDATPLLMAVFRNQLDAVKLLLDHGANPNVRGAEGDSPLRVCADRGDLHMAELLLRAGADRTIDSWGGPAGATALERAVARLDVTFISLLLKFGADPNAKGEYGNPAIRLLPPENAENHQQRINVQRLLSAHR